MLNLMSGLLLSPLVRLIVKRLAIAVVTLLGISLVIFSLLALAPGNPLGGIGHQSFYFRSSQGKSTP